MPRLAALLLAPLAALTLVAGCGGGDDTSAATTTEAAGTPGDPCAAARRIADADDTYEAELQDAVTAFTADPASQAAQDAFVQAIADTGDAAGPLLRAYDDLAASEPEVADDAGVVARFTRDSLDALGRVRTFDDLEKWLDDTVNGPGTAEAVGATLAIDRWAKATCGVTIAD